MKFCVLKYSDLRNPKFNPETRWDTGMGFMISGLVNPNPHLDTKLSARDQIKALLASDAKFDAWLTELRKLETLPEIEKHVATAINCKSTVVHLLDFHMQQAIKTLALALCDEEAEHLKTTIQPVLDKIARFRKIKAQDSGIREIQLCNSIQDQSTLPSTSSDSES